MTLHSRDKRYIVNTYNRLPIEIVKAKGSYIYDIDGEKYLDTFMGISVNNLGHNPDYIVDAIKSQLDKYSHVSNYFANEPATKLAELLVENSCAHQVFFTNSGTEATEAALKLVKKYGKMQGKKIILSANKSFHGRTTGSLALTGQAKYQDSFRPLIEDIYHFDYNDIESLESVVNEDTLGVFIELVQGEGGVTAATKEFINRLVELRKQYGFLIIADEIQTGLGRAGDLFAYEAYDFRPDLICLAKSLGGGLPLGGLLVSENLSEVFQPGDHGTTFGGNPVSCAGGVAVLEKLLEPKFLEESKIKGELIKSSLRKLQEKYPSKIKEIRGRGLMIGIELFEEGITLRNKALKEENLLINITSKNVIRLLPSLEITNEEIQTFIEKLDHIMS